VNALAGLYERYYGLMVWVAYAVLLEPQSGGGCGQQSFVTACHKMGSLRQPDRFGPWLTTICRRVAQDMRAGQETRYGPPEGSGVSAARAGRHERIRQGVKEAVDALPPMYREVIVLHYYSGMSYQEIESVLGVSGDVVKGRLARGPQADRDPSGERGLPSGAMIMGRTYEEQELEQSLRRTRAGRSATLGFQTWREKNADAVDALMHRAGARAEHDRPFCGSSDLGERS